MPSACRRQLLPVAVLIAAFAAGCGKASTTPKDPAPNTPPTNPSPAPSPVPNPPAPPPPGVIVVTGTERIGWDEQIDPGTNIRDYHFVAFVDARQTTLPDIRCDVTAGASGYPCSAQLPLLTDGQHTLRIAASRAIGSAEPVSDRSAELVIFKGQITSAATVDDLAPPAPEPLDLTASGRPSADRSGIHAEIVATHLAPVTDLAALPDGRIVIAERSGIVRAMSDGVMARIPMAALQRISQDHGGLMSMAPHPGFAVNHLLYLLYAADTNNGVTYRLARGREVEGVLGEFAVLGDIAEAEAGGSGVLRFGADGRLYMVLSDLSETSPANAASFRGKLLRLDDDGRTPADSLRGSPIVSGGHKEALGLTSAPLDGRLFEAERAGSGRINLVRPGVPSAPGERLVAPMVDLGANARPGGIIVYSGTVFPRWRGQLLVARLDGEGISRIPLDGASAPEAVFPDISRSYGRIRSLVEAADGSIYFGTANREGRAGARAADDDRVVRLRPASRESSGAPQQ